MVHGVGRHDPLSSLLRVYQTFRSNLRSPEAPVLFEDRIPDWRLDDVNEDGTPPYLRLVPRFPAERGDVSAVYLYFTSFPYRLRRAIGPVFGARREVDLNQPGRPFATRALKVLSFIPTLVAMMVPIAVGAILTRAFPDPRISIGWYLAGLIAFTLYLILCAACELVASWKSVLKELGLSRQSTAESPRPREGRARQS